MSIAKSKKVGEMYGNANEHIDRSTICSLIAFDMQLAQNITYLYELQQTIIF